MNKIYEITVKVLTLIVLVNLTILTSSMTINKFNAKTLSPQEIERIQEIKMLDSLNTEFNKEMDKLLNNK